MFLFLSILFLIMAFILWKPSYKKGTNYNPVVVFMTFFILSIISLFIHAPTAYQSSQCVTYYQNKNIDIPSMYIAEFNIFKNECNILHFFKFTSLNDDVIIPFSEVKDFIENNKQKKN